MILKIKIPKWAEKRHLRVMAGVDMLAYKLGHTNILRVKKVKCNQCGDCCRGLTKRWIYPTTDDGTCVYLAPDNPGTWKCTCEPVPYHCFMGSQEKGKYDNEHCVVEYEDIEIK